MAEARFFNRDLSLLNFNARVLSQAGDDSFPLLERVRFLCIFSSNMDEFFMKRVGYLQRLEAIGAPKAGNDAMAPGEIIGQVRARIDHLFDERARLWSQSIRPDLAAQGVELADWSSLSPAELERASAFFKAEVFPVLTPLAVDPAHPFPFLSNLSLSLGVRLRHPGGADSLFARLKIADMLPQWVRVSPDKGSAPLRMCRLTDLVAAHLSHFFPEMTIESTMLFRVLRNADVEQVTEDADDLLNVVEAELRLRRMADIVAVQQPLHTEAWFQDILGEELRLRPGDFYPCPGELNWLALNEVASLPYSHLRFKPWVPVTVPALAGDDADLFRVVREQDQLVHLPYESFQTSVERLLRAAARDPQTLAIKIALYRLGDDSPLIPLLIEAAEAGKQVVCVVEIKARFDEARNIYWSEQLEKAGVHVVYGVVGLKTHAKITLVVRRENDGYRFYGHVGTGNYNPSTARLYSDFGLFTSDPALTQEMIEIFNYLTGLSLHRNYRRFLLAPVNMRTRFLELIDAETAHAAAGRPGRIVAKMNALEDTEIIEHLYAASAAGVRIDLIVRGFCCLRPGVPGLSENITVRSIIGRFLEHSRTYIFFKGQNKPMKADYFIGSADWMNRNLNNRVETIAPVQATPLKREIWGALEMYFDDTRQAWQLNSDGSYVPLRTKDSGPGVQDRLMAYARERARGGA
ncbi:MAG TPA: polyphosphate kinase 1 [bacterium]|jgi:polyphosphate kinase|nr:polyphosphate kinase 1 [bacterium]